MIGADIQQRMWPSLALAIPTFIIGIAVNIVFALFVVMFRATAIDTAALILCVALLSISAIFYILGGQYFIAKLWHWVPISGYLPGLDRKSTRLNSSHVRISYAVSCLKKKRVSF